MSLTRGALANIYAGEDVVEPNMQVLGYKRIAGSDQPRYRILLSDGENLNSFSMMATQLNPLIHDKQLEQFTIIKLDKYICNQVQGQSKRVVILLDVSIVTPGDQVNHKLGDPRPMEGEINLPKFIFKKTNSNEPVGGAAKRAAENDEVRATGKTRGGGEYHTSASDLVSKKRKTPKKIEDSVEGTNIEVTQKIISKIDELNMELVDLNQSSKADRKHLEESMKKDIEELKLTQEEELDTTLKQEEEELQGVKEYYAQLIKEQSKQSKVKQINVKEKCKADIKEIEENRNATKIAIEKAKKDLTTTLSKLENNDDVMPNVKKDMECPVCLEEMKPPTSIFQCSFGHLICGGCQGRLEGSNFIKCPTCKEADVVGRAWAMERLARTLYGQP